MKRQGKVSLNNLWVPSNTHTLGAMWSSLSHIHTFQKAFTMVFFQPGLKLDGFDVMAIAILMLLSGTFVMFNLIS